MAELVTRRVGGLAVYDQAGTAADRVVLVHGSMDRATSFAKVARLLEGLTVVRYDRRGYGRSVEAGVAPDLAGHVDDLVAVLGDESAVLVGHSFGGVLALLAADRRPDLVEALAVFEAPAPWEPWWPAGSAGSHAIGALTGDGSADEAAERFMRRMIGDERWERLPPSTRTARRGEGRALVTELRAMRALPGAPYQLGPGDVPVVVGYGTATDPRHQRASCELADHFGVEPVVVDGAAHAAHHSHPAEFAGMVRLALTLRSLPADR